MVQSILRHMRSDAPIATLEYHQWRLSVFSLVRTYYPLAERGGHSSFGATNTLDLFARTVAGQRAGRHTVLFWLQHYVQWHSDTRVFLQAQIGMLDWRSRAGSRLGTLLTGVGMEQWGASEEWLYRGEVLGMAGLLGWLWASVHQRGRRRRGRAGCGYPAAAQDPPVSQASPVARQGSPTGSEAASYFKFACRRCDGHIEVAEEWRGRPLVCPHCGEAIDIPAEGISVSAGPLASPRRGWRRWLAVSCSAAAILVVVAVPLGRRWLEGGQTPPLTTIGGSAPQSEGVRNPVSYAPPAEPADPAPAVASSRPPRPASPDVVLPIGEHPCALRVPAITVEGGVAVATVELSWVKPASHLRRGAMTLAMLFQPQAWASLDAAILSAGRAYSLKCPTEELILLESDFDVRDARGAVSSGALLTPE